MARQTSDDARRIEQAAREWIKVLGHWRVCERKTCRRSGCCRGDVRVCFPINHARLPDGVRRWWRAVVVLQRFKAPFDDIVQQLRVSAEGDDLWDWNGTTGVVEDGLRSMPPIVDSWRLALRRNIASTAPDLLS